jgi:integrase
MRALAAAAVRPHLQAAGLAPRTTLVYMRALQRAEGWCQAHGAGGLHNVSPSVIGAYADSLPRTAASRRQLRSAIGHYWRIVGRKNPPLWAIRVPRKPKMVCKALDADDARVFAKAAYQRGDRAGLAALFALLMALRREEIACLRWSDLRNDGWLSVTGKGNKEARLPLHHVLVEVLAGWPRSGPYVFEGRFGGHITPTTIWHWVRTVADDAGLGRVATHVCRHTALATSNDATGDLRATQDLARHDDIQTTSGYTRATAGRLRAAVEAIDYGL